MKTLKVHKSLITLYMLRIAWEGVRNLYVLQEGSSVLRNEDFGLRVILGFHITGREEGYEPDGVDFRIVYGSKALEVDEGLKVDYKGQT